MVFDFNDQTRGKEEETWTTIQTTTAATTSAKPLHPPVAAAAAAAAEAAQETRPEKNRKNVLRTFFSLPNHHGEEEEGSIKPPGCRRWQAVHARAAQQLVPDAQAAERVLATLEAYCAGEVGDISIFCLTHGLIYDIDII